MGPGLTLHEQEAAGPRAHDRHILCLGRATSVDLLSHRSAYGASKLRVVQSLKDYAIKCGMADANPSSYRNTNCVDALTTIAAQP